MSVTYSSELWGRTTVSKTSVWLSGIVLGKEMFGNQSALGRSYPSYYMPGGHHSRGIGDVALERTDRNPCLHRVYILVRRVGQ